MPVLHPIFYVILFLLIVGAIWEFSTRQGYKVNPIYYIGSGLLLLAVGFRKDVGADYQPYRNIYATQRLYFSYNDIWAKALFRSSPLDLEWLYSLLNMSFFDIGLPFFAFTFFIAALSLTLKSKFIVKYSPLPVLSLLLLYMPHFMIAESGQMRQGIGIAIAIIAFIFAIERRLFMFLFFMYLAIGMHKTNIIFLPTYWLIRIPLNRWRILLLISVCIALSPFKIYEYLGTDFIENLAPQDLYAGYSGYINDEEAGAEMGFQKTDLLYLGIIALMIIYDRISCETIPYYEYFRNISVFGFCLFFLVKGNTIFAVRGLNTYIFFSMCMILPCIAYTVRQKLNNQTIFLLCIIYSLYITYSFTINQGVRAGFTSDFYQNFLIN